MKKPLHLIIVGPDKIGKTTVCELLSKKLKIPVIKMQDMPKHFSEPELPSEVFNKALVQFKDFSFICDRGYPSSIVYSRHFSRDYNLSYIKDIEKQLDPIIVVLVGQTRGDDDLVTKEDQRLLMNHYILEASIHGWKRILVDGKTPAQICKEILDYV